MNGKLTKEELRNKEAQKARQDLDRAMLQGGVTEDKFDSDATEKLRKVDNIGRYIALGIWGVIVIYFVYSIVFAKGWMKFFNANIS